MGGTLYFLVYISLFIVQPSLSSPHPPEQARQQNKYNYNYKKINHPYPHLLVFVYLKNLYLI